MEYSVIEGKKLNSNNYECQGFRNIKSREHCNTNLLQLTSPHCHDPGADYSGKIIITNTIKRKAENSTTKLRELFNECCRESDAASSVTFRSLESSMYKRRRILQPKLPSSALEFDSFMQESQYYTNHIQTIIYKDQVAVIWGSSQMVNCLRNTTDIQLDATFKVVPRLFYQLFILHS